MVFNVFKILLTLRNLQVSSFNSMCCVFMWPPTTSLSPWLKFLGLVALAKPSGGICSIVMGKTLYRLLSKALCL